MSAVAPVIDPARTGEPPALAVSGLRKRFGRVQALDGVTLEVPPGRVHGLVGRNGAGKSTLLRIVLGLVRPDSGDVLVHGTPLGDHVGDVPVAGFPDSPSFPPYLTGRQALEQLVRLDAPAPAPAAERRRRVRAALADVGLEDRADERVSGWSLGMRQRLGIAAALLRSPRLLLLDEPMNGLDPAAFAVVRELLRRLADGGTTVVLSSHDMTALDSLCHSVSILHEGQTAYDGSMAGLSEFGPFPVHRLHTSDDATAAAGCVSLQLEVEPHAQGGLRVAGPPERLDALTVALGRAGVAVRGLAMEGTALEQAFLALTGDGTPTEGGGR